MSTTLQPKILLVTLKYDFKVMQRENSPNEEQKWYPRGTNFLGYKLFKWGTIGNPGTNENEICKDVHQGIPKHSFLYNIEES